MGLPHAPPCLAAPGRAGLRVGVGASVGSDGTPQNHNLVPLTGAAFALATSLRLNPSHDRWAAQIWWSSHDTCTQGLKVAWIHANEPLINQRMERQSSPAGVTQVVALCETGSQVGAGTEPGIVDVPAKGSGMFQPWDWRCSSPRIGDVPVVGWIRDAPAPGAGMLPVMESPNLGIELRTSSTDISTAAGLDPEPLPPRFTLPQIPMWPPRGHRALMKEHVPHPACVGQREGTRWGKPKGSSAHGALRLPQPPPGVSAHLFNHCFPSFNIITRQPASQHQLLQITINGSLFSRLLLNRYRN